MVGESSRVQKPKRINQEAKAIEIEAIYNKDDCNKTMPAMMERTIQSLSTGMQPYLTPTNNKKLVTVLTMRTKTAPTDYLRQAK